MDLKNLDWKEYGYVGQTKQRGGVFTLRPQLGVRLIHGGRFSDTIGLLDSGGDFTLINEEFAPGLGINLEECEKVTIGSVVGTGIPARLCKLRIRLQGFEDEFEIDVRFVANMPIDVILGQSDIFERFRIVFQRKKRKFYIAREIET